MDLFCVKAHKATRKIREDILKTDKSFTDETIIEQKVNHEIAIDFAHPRKEEQKYVGKKKSRLHLAVDNCSGIPVASYFDNQES